MKQEVDISIKSISDKIRYKIVDYGSIWVISTQVLLCSAVGYYLVIDPRSMSPEHFPSLILSLLLLFFACVFVFLSRKIKYRGSLLGTAALFISASSILLAHIITIAYASPDDGKKILLVSFLIMLMSWNSSRYVLAIGTLPVVAFHIYLTSMTPMVELIDIVISGMKFPILLVVFYATMRRLFEFVEDKFLETMSKIQRLERNSHLDELTRIKNRKGFNSELKKAIDNARRSHSELSIAIIDIDFFKQYNDSKGHPAGDLCLKNVAAILRSQCQRSIDNVCRIGGEEFALIMPVTSAEQAICVVQNIQMALAKICIKHPKSSISDHVTVSIGIAEFGPKDDFESIYQRADKAMYKAKVAGRDQYVVCLEECTLCRSNEQMKTVDAIM
ncbi:GGDEF domain-containing protein [Vibrio crassostreae]|uniref:GGDEF domain-containing protein n=1 Tax=Vibrio crassostreae TaxID=246167 RepID=UPI00062EDFF0|nr:GGDEF domain-containing protein [Vibrio crassostreae]TCO00567.1 diguanylate cyclase (GGDEF)-like protein [Vibrio crassostreae]CAK2052989.1 Diguanylate cyclase (GGDEF)-like protein [Vibrio crassostreae]CAK2066420.1 Diguanylate cyclase (GGDEF)-like protein [Vibrio crassostreae]CAK2067501.1 Diguanylate cyclase (GGDEF)-like protein [Vibrio crassostreae]CAK2070110.1 Diguanylate cyclase (GGDEF)-like protein [Vibrio crassostreae]